MNALVIAAEAPLRLFSHLDLGDQAAPEAVRQRRRRAGTRRSCTCPHRIPRGRRLHHHRPADRQRALRPPVRRAAAHPRDRARGEDQECPRPRRCRTRNTRLRPRRWRQQCRLCRRLSRRRNRDCQGQTGIAAVGVFNSYFSGRKAYYLERIVNAGLVGLHTASGAPHIVPPGATRPPSRSSISLGSSRVKALNKELPELKRQSREFGAACIAHGLPGEMIEVADCHHYAVLEQLARPDGVLAKALAVCAGINPA